MAERQPSKLHVASSNLVSRSTDPFVADAPAALRAAGLRLRSALDRTIRLTPDLTAAAEALSAAYRSRAPATGRPFVHDRSTATAYAAARMPATFAATGRALVEGARGLPGFAPRSITDIGAGTGAATWAANAVWPSLAEHVLLDREPAMLELGRRLADAGGTATWLAAADWRLMTLADASVPAADLVVAAYILGELSDVAAARLVDAAWLATRGALVIVEPGSRAGFGRILAARARLIAAGARIAAPCPGNVACPVRDPEWCHFLARLERSPLQRLAKAASRSWEDEPYSYVVAARGEVDPAPRVVLGRPRHRPGLVELRVCQGGAIEPIVRSRRHGPAWRATDDLEWGDRVPAAVGIDAPADR